MMLTELNRYISPNAMTALTKYCISLGFFLVNSTTIQMIDVLQSDLPAHITRREYHLEIVVLDDILHLDDARELTVVMCLE